MTGPALDIRDLIVRAAHRAVLEIERLCADAGTLVALMGPNGAGKSTLLRTCLGLAHPARGSVMVLGENVGRLRGAALAGLRRRIGYVPQLLPIHSELPLTVREVVAIGRTARAGLFHALSRDDWRTVDRWIECLGLTALAGRAFRDVSGGERRKTIVARAMAQEPQFLLLDEPTANLDIGWRERIVDTIEQLYGQTRLSVLLVCHELEVLPPSCRQVLLLEAGRLTATGSPEDVFTAARVCELYGPGLRPLHQGLRHAVVPEGGPHD